MPAQRIPNAQIPPRHALGYLAQQWSDGSWRHGSASMLDAQTLLTCSSNLVDAVTDRMPHGYAVEALFYPGYNQSDATEPPPGGLPVSAGFYSSNFAAGQDTWDVAVCRLATPVSAPPAFYFTPTLTGSEIIGEIAALTGYPDAQNREMWENIDEVATVHVPTNALLWTHDTWSGGSGGPIWTYDAVNFVVQQHALHVSRQPQQLRLGVLVTAAIRSWILGAWAAPSPEVFGFQLVGR